MITVKTKRGGVVNVLDGDEVLDISKFHTVSNEPLTIINDFDNNKILAVVNDLGESQEFTQEEVKD